MIAARRTCTDRGRVHQWVDTGVEVVDGVACHTGRCAWCRAVAARPVGRRSTPIRSGCRARP